MALQFISYMLQNTPTGLGQNPVLQYTILLFLQQIVGIHKCDKYFTWTHDSSSPDSLPNDLAANLWGNFFIFKISLIFCIWAKELRVFAPFSSNLFPLDGKKQK